MRRQLDRSTVSADSFPKLQRARSKPNAAQQAGSREATVHPLPFRGTEAELVDGVARRDAAALRELHRRHAARMHALLFRLLGPDPELEDVLQDAFVRVLRSIHTLRDPEALPGWLKGITVHAAQTHFQRRKRRAWLRFLPWEEVPEPAVEPDDSEPRDAVSALYEVLATLPPDERVAVSLRLVEQMAIEDGARALGVSESTFKRRVRSGTKRLMAKVRNHPALRTWLGEGCR